MRKVRRLPLHAQFVRAVRTSDLGIVKLSIVAGFAAYPQLSAILSARRARQTPLITQRLQCLALFIHYEGPIFRERRAS